MCQLDTGNCDRIKEGQEFKHKCKKVKLSESMNGESLNQMESDGAT